MRLLIGLAERLNDLTSPRTKFDITGVMIIPVSHVSPLYPVPYSVEFFYVKYLHEGCGRENGSQPQIFHDCWLLLI